MTTVSYRIPAINCKHCTHTIETEVGELQGVSSVRANADTKEVTISFEPPATEENIKQLLAEISYPISS